MTRDLSVKFRFLTFSCIALLPWVHGYNLQIGYLTPYTTPEEPLTFTTFFEYFAANGLLRFRIPILFLISGYLYAHYDTRQPYGQRIGKRFKTLMVPYLLWSAFGLLLTFLLQQFPYSADVVRLSQLDQQGDNRPYLEIGWLGVLQRWLLTPVAFQLWFILVLFVYNMMYPAIKWLVTRYAWLWLGLTGLLWLGYFNLILIEAQGLFFFSVGVWLRVAYRNVQKLPPGFSLGLAWIFFVGLCAIKTFIAFEFEPAEFSTTVTLAVLHKLAVVAGVLAVWYSVDELAMLAMDQPWFRKLTGYSFFIYGMHIPLQAYVMQYFEMQFSAFPLYRISTYLLVPAGVVAACIAAAWLAHRYTPGFYKLMSGGRGL